MYGRSDRLTQATSHAAHGVPRGSGMVDIFCPTEQRRDWLHAMAVTNIHRMFRASFATALWHEKPFAHLSPLLAISLPDGSCINPQTTKQRKPSSHTAQLLSTLFKSQHVYIPFPFFTSPCIFTSSSRQSQAPHTSFALLCSPRISLCCSSHLHFIVKLNVLYHRVKCLLRKGGIQGGADRVRQVEGRQVKPTTVSG